MNDERVPKPILYGELSYGNRDVAGPEKRHEDYIKTLNCKLETPPDSLDALSTQRNSWRIACPAGAAKCKEKHHERMR